MYRDEFNPDLPTKILIHGYNNNAGGMKSISDAFLVHAGYDFNVILVDWAKGAAGLLYPQKASNVRVVGACTGNLLQELVAQKGASLSEMHCIGTSLGAHGCGYVGRYLGGQLGRITGLDPAKQWFRTDNVEVRLDKSDAIFNDNIHTNNAGLINFGIGKSIGHVDFFPNKGKNQPPCKGKPGPNCPHMISQAYFIQSIKAKDNCTFTAFPCDRLNDSDEGGCETCTNGVDCQRMGYFADTMPGRGTYFLRTTQNAPYCEN
ncbi:hypothetical protein CAPTEDRAFT_216637 [Capitella teleta]|uniref:Lipase domain-containing protein n=1 Tax=Capitella teleta TaxID=283909 RepID=R7V9Y4_CAPTE|nr:hypothetical protein CAPTEDRAFT_216637 [Capitella teleta]|eukprot:ELU15322.1 hypothetical protein CAPTEDRAFT_216637 [Capitella teleta]